MTAPVIAFPSVRALAPSFSHRSPADDELCELAHLLMRTRQSVLPKRLVEPGPSEAQLQRLLGAAADAPDHGQITPWRFVIVPVDKRLLLAEAFALALVDRDPGATPQQIEDARAKAYRAPLLMLAIARLGRAEPDIPPLERMVSLGCAVQNMLLSAHAMGFGSGLTSGQAMRSPRLRQLFSLQESEEAVCFVNVGTVAKYRLSTGQRPRVDQFVSLL